MQVQNLTTSNVKKVVNKQATAKLASEQKAEKVKPVEVVDATKAPSFSRTLEAYSDCV